MATQEKTWNVANRLHSQKDSDNPEVNHIIAGADEIYDDEKGAKQSDINAQADAALADRYTKDETYSKEQLDALITTPDVNYVTVATFAELPQPGEANTTYRVSSYDGTQVDASKYALYAWNGATYQLLAVRTAIGEVFDVSEYNSGATYETLTAALAAVPASVQKGGMSIKFILRTNTGTEEEPVYKDEYVQYRLMNTAWSSVVSDWQGVDDKPKSESHNLVESDGVHAELYKRNYINYSFNSADTNKKSGYISSAGNISSPTSTSYFIYYFPVSIGDKFLLKYNSFTSSVARAYAIYSTDDPDEIGENTSIDIGPVGAAGVDFNIEISDNSAKLICVTTHRITGVYNDWGCELKKILYVNRFNEIKDGAIASMIALGDYSISGNVVYDSNEIPQSYNITWADGTTGTAVMSNFNSDVFEYTTITATYDDKTVIYSLTYDSNGYITNKTFNIQ